MGARGLSTGSFICGSLGRICVFLAGRYHLENWLFLDKYQFANGIELQGRERTTSLIIPNDTHCHAATSDLRSYYRPFQD
jgi:hypothetical protein